MPDMNSNDLSSSVNHCMLVSQTCNITSDHLKASNCLHFVPQCASSLSSLFSSMSLLFLSTLAVLNSKAVDYCYESYQSLQTWLIKFLRFSSSFLHLFLLPAHSSQNRWYQRTAEADSHTVRIHWTAFCFTNEPTQLRHFFVFTPEKWWSSALLLSQC